MKPGPVSFVYEGSTSRTEIRSIQTTHAKTNNFDPPHKKEVNFDPNTKTKSNSICHKLIRLLSTPPMKSSQFDPYSNIKMISMPRHKNLSNFDPDTKTSFFQPLYKHPVNSDPCTEMRSSSPPYTVIKLILTAHTKIY